MKMNSVKSKPRSIKEAVVGVGAGVLAASITRDLAVEKGLTPLEKTFAALGVIAVAAIVMQETRSPFVGEALARGIQMGLSPVS